MLALFLSKIGVINKGTLRQISFFSVCSYKSERHSDNPNSFGPLTNLPDYTYLDGRPTPLGSNLKKRLIKQKEVAQKIVTFNKELTSAKERYIKMQKQKSEHLEQQIARQLKPKGHLLK